MAGDRRYSSNSPYLESIRNHLICLNTRVKVEYHANENPLKILKKIAYVGQRLMYPIIKRENTLPC